MSQPCIFCKIVARDLPATVRFENDQVLAFDDIHPDAPVHILVIPKRHIEHLGTATDADSEAVAAILPAIREIATKLGLEGFKLAASNGVAYGQDVPHLHFHLLSGQPVKSVL